MIKLIQNCSHGNGVAIFLSKENQKKNIIKVSTTKVGIAQIEKEIEGWNWYTNRKEPSYFNGLCEIITRRDSYLKIKIPYITGQKAKYSNGIIKNEGLVENIVRQYCHIWKGYEKDKYPLHGDLSIDNIIFNNEGVHIIDWEYFSLNATPFGFDAYNLLFEQLLFSMKGRKNPTKKELDILIKIIHLIRSKSNESNYFNINPLLSTQQFIKINSKLWKNQNRRLPVLFFNKECVKIIDDMLYKQFC